MSVDFSSLNAPQKEAVLCVEGPLLVLAGAGSGKTSVLTYRIAHMVEDLKIAPWEILAITFTNKASKEMQSRIGSLIGNAANGMWVLTFHKCCGRILRANPERVGLTQNYTIYDTDDQKRLLKQIIKDLGIDDKKFQLSSIANQMSSAKNDLISADEYAATAENSLQKEVAKVYPEYQRRLLAANAVDFDDMLFYGHKILSENPDILKAYQDRFKYLLVDEYQDTNHAQYEICKLLAAATKNIMVVGDDDQSIYSWRGADVQNILDFERDYCGCKTVKLEENYRSTGNILNAANSVIAKNMRRKSKKLFTSGEEGEKVGVYSASDERDEGRWIAGEIEKSIKRGEIKSYDDVAILYRTNAQSRTLEDMMLRSGIPYKIVGGTKFFDRKEIRDVMAYLSLVVNNSDDVAFERVVNVPKRGVGNTTLAKIRDFAHAMQTSEFVAAASLAGSGELRPAVKNEILKFVMFIESAANFSGELRNIVQTIVENSGVIDELKEQNTDEAKSRIQNILEFYTVVSEFSESHGKEEAEFEAPNPDNQASSEPQKSTFADTLPDFMEWARLRTDLDALSEGSSSVTLMTCHSAKGLEFDHVYVAGMEDGVFPVIRAFSDEADREEERRLAYVAITRAKKRLVLCHAQSRRLYGMSEAHAPSQFLREIPEDLRESRGVGSAGFEGSNWEKRGSRRGIAGSGTEQRYTFGEKPRADVNANPFSAPARTSTAKFELGDTVEHKTFGRGKVVGTDGDRLSVLFERSRQTKTLLRDFAPIVKIN